MEDLKKKINFDPSLLYYSPAGKEDEGDEKSMTNVETYNSINRKHVCTVCGKRFFSSNSLNAHMKHHPPNEQPNAEIDKDRVNLNRKNQYVWNKGMKCNKLECNFIALDAVEYSKHISSCEGTRMNKNSENVTFCEPCDSYLSSENHYKAHLILQHSGSDPEISLKEFDAQQTTVSDPISLYSENLESEGNSKMKNVSHSIYPESLISRKKSKEPDNEEEKIKSGEVLGQEATELPVLNGNSVEEDVERNTIEVEVVPPSKMVSNEVVEKEIPVDIEITEQSPEVESRKLHITNDSSDSEKIELVEKPNSKFDIEELNNKVANLQENKEQSKNLDIKKPTYEDTNPQQIEAKLKNVYIVEQTSEVDNPQPNEEKSENLDIKKQPDDISNPLLDEEKSENLCIEKQPDEVSDPLLDKEKLENSCIEKQTDEVSNSQLNKEKLENLNLEKQTDEVVSNPQLNVNKGKLENLGIEKQTDEVVSNPQPNVNDEKLDNFDVMEQTKEVTNLQQSEEKSKNVCVKEQTNNLSNIQLNEEESENTSEIVEISVTEQNTDSDSQNPIETVQLVDNLLVKKQSSKKNIGVENSSVKIDSLPKSKIKKVQEKPLQQEHQRLEIKNEVHKKEDSDFDEFDYNRAGNKKYSKSSNKLNQSEELKMDSNEITTNKSDEVTIENKPRDDRLSAELNTKERSIRTRKKLILPDYEYDSDYKSYCSKEPVKKRESLPKESDSAPRKRGRPKKNQTSIDSISSTDVSSNYSQSTIDDKIEISYLNKTENFTEMIPPEVKKESSNFKPIRTALKDKPETSNLSNECSDSDDEYKIELEEIIEPMPVKKKRGRPRKIKKEKVVSERSTQKEPTSLDKESEESIFSDLANALLSLGNPVTHKPQETIQPQDNTKESSSFELNESPPLKKKKGRPPKVKIVEASDENQKTEITDDPVMEMKNETDGKTVSIGEIDNSNSNEAVSSKKEPVQEISEEARMNSFMNDLSLMANVSTPKKRGRPKAMRKENPYAKKSHLELLSSAAYYRQKLHKAPRFNEVSNKNKMLKPKYEEQEVDFFKKKIRHNAIKSHLDAESFSLLQNNSVLKKRGRPLKNKMETTDESQLDLSMEQSNEIEDQEDMVVHYIQTQNDDISTDISNISRTTEPVQNQQIVIKRKKGRPRKIHSENSEVSVSDVKNDSLEKNTQENTEEKDSIEFSRSQVRRTSIREDSDFIYESYHPKKKRIRLFKPDEEIENVKTEPEKIVKPAPVAKLKPPRVRNPPAAEILDETFKINEELVKRDNKNRVKYGKLFKRPKLCSATDKYKEDAMITCGRCEEKMTFRHYKLSHQISHYFLCWIQGESKIDLSDDKETTRILQAAITPESLRKKIIRLACEKCSDVRKSVVGYISHARFCQNEGKEDLFETCSICGKNLRPSSVRFHYIKFHGGYNTAKTKDASASTETSACGEVGPEDSDEERQRSTKTFRMGFSRTHLNKKDVLEDEEFWTNLKTSYDLYMCMGLGCKHMTLSKDDLKTHIASCCKSFCEFSCTFCQFKTKYENEIIYHSKRNCRENSDLEDKEEEEVQPTERRMSTRKKKRKYIYDNSDLNESSDEKKVMADEDFQASESEPEDDSDSDVDYVGKGLKPRKSASERSVISDKLGLRHAFNQHCVGRTDPLSWTVEMRLKRFSGSPLHLHMKVSKEWEMSSLAEIDKHCPIHQKSMKLYFDNQPSSQFSLFQSDVIKGVPICFVGGPVWAMAWAPLPASVTEQYLAVSTLQHMNHLINVHCSVRFPSLIQLWKYSSIDNISNDIHKPTLSLAIAHQYGAVWAMEWCPSGGFSTLSQICRLGILAAATSSGFVIVYNIPKLESNSEISTDEKEVIMNPKPDLILKIQSENVQCTRIVWDLNAPHNTLIGGFSDGSVAFWNINTTSVLLKKGNVVYPYRTFDAHNSPITALDLHWIDNSRFLLTGSTNRVARYWDLNDLSGPMYESERATPVTNAIWMQHWIVTANAHDFGAIVGESTAYISHPRDSVEKRKTLSSLRDTFWSVSYSFWNDVIASASNGGHVSVFSTKHLSLLSFKNADFKNVTSTGLVNLEDDEKTDVNVEEISSEMPANYDIYDCSAVIQNHGIHFMDRCKKKTNSEILNVDFEKASAASVNKICWNQNYNSFNWLAVGYECGFVRVIRVERFEKHYLTKFYKTNENNATSM